MFSKSLRSAWSVRGASSQSCGGQRWISPPSFAALSLPSIQASACVTDRQENSKSDFFFFPPFFSPRALSDRPGSTSPTDGQSLLFYSWYRRRFSNEFVQVEADSSPCVREATSNKKCGLHHHSFKTTSCSSLSLESSFYKTNLYRPSSIYSPQARF